MKMISIIIVTYNRESLLKKCLNSILSQVYRGEFEVIVIDNSSSDGTPMLFENLADHKIKYFRNGTRRSLINCKNLGLSFSSGEIIAFTDDDCIVSENWLQAITDYLADYDFVAGPVLPVIGTKFPGWWRDSLNWLVGINFNPGRKYLPLGSNIAFRKSVLDGLSKKNPKTIIKDDCYLPYREDNCRVKKALDARFSMGVNKKMVVYHRIPKNRFTLSYLIRRSHNDGRAGIAYDKSLKNLIFSFMALPINAVRMLICCDISRFFRMVESIGYITSYIKTPL